MTPLLTLIEARVLGCLLEKEKTTPDYYPLTLNALTNACNQKSSRDPVMELDQTKVVHAVFSLKDRGIVLEKNDGGRVAKYAHNFSKLIHASDDERAVLCVLLLRGPQTAGEIKNRTDRLAAFNSPAQVESILQTLATRSDGPCTVLLPRQTGQKERRYAHLLSGDPTAPQPLASPPPSETPPMNKFTLEERVTQLETRVRALENQKIS